MYTTPHIHTQVGTHESGIDQLVSRLLMLGQKVCRVEALETKDQANARAGGGNGNGTTSNGSKGKKRSSGSSGSNGTIRRGVREVLTPGLAVGIERRLGPLTYGDRLDDRSVNSIKRYGVYGSLR